MKGSQTAIILGAGLIGMHVAECLAEHGIRVQVVEMLPHILPAYFDKDASGMIQRVLEKHGVTFFTGRRATEVAWKKRSVEVLLEDGERLQADLLLVATGVKPRISFLEWKRHEDQWRHTGRQRDENESATYICRWRCCFG